MVPTPPGACPIHLKARIASATVEYQRAVDATFGGTGEGNIPLGPVVLTPSASGSFDKVQTVSDKYVFDIKPENTPPHEALGETNSQPSTNPIVIKSATVVRSQIEGQLQQIIAGAHPRPCISPKSFDIGATTQIEKKIGGGFSVNFLVAKIGATTSKSTKDTQSVTLNVDLKPSEAVM